MKRSLLATLCGLVFLAPRLCAQELEPRAYSPSPIGTTFVITGIGRSQGAILLDPSLDVDNVQGDLWIATLGAGRVFDLAGRQARILAVFPLAWGAITGDVGPQPERQDLAGLVDPRFKLSIALRGGPALSPAEFARAPRRVVIGASVTIVPPIGQYNSAQLVNLGYNRWAFKPEAGLSHQVGRWTFDVYGGVWLFTPNDSYFPGTAHRQQDPVIALQTHVSYALPRRTWLAFNGTWFAGGQTSVERAVSPDEQRNSRFGLTFSVPASGQQSIKFVYSTGATTRRGNDFNTFNVTWQIVWF
jgi:outer membrane putative beta-barrel porin/alpha-amylase